MSVEVKQSDAHYLYNFSNASLKGSDQSERNLLSQDSELIINDYQSKIQEEEAEFTRNLTKLIKTHEEKIKDLVRERNWKLSNLSKQNSIINSNQVESDDLSLKIEDDKAPENKLEASAIDEIETQEDKAEISVIDLEKSLEIMRINKTPISIQSISPASISYHDLDPDVYDYNGILTYSPSVDTKTVSNTLTDFTIIDDEITSISQTNPIIYNVLPPRTEPISNEKKKPNYQRMSIPELKALAKYGIRPSGKETMIRQLEIIWNKIHENEGDDNVDQEARNQAENCNDIHEDSDDNDASTDISLTEELYKYIKGNRQLYCRVLRYEVLEFDQLLNEINNAGILCTDRQLQLFLDNKGIIHSSNTKSKQWRHKKDKSKKNPSVEDAVYDKHWQELRDLEARYNYVLPNSPTQKASQTASNKFRPVVRQNPMLSLDSVDNYADLLKFDERVKKILKTETEIEYICE
ncbi:16825_t:CDS:2 [Dentiscutata erythropus]|uniref:Structure-specific endonuclease subunit SLX4 n=1 Tax=Dentiscutata erythropus TaxID=1348616 RepID=A0A9N9BTY2_9GLOM|nr:16825_t:CDS:2 [Dentiscutata erythropus]